jgi:hypothetical protein
LTSHDAHNNDKTHPALPAKLRFFDSTDVHWCPDVGYSYESAGGQKKVDSPGLNNPWRALFGSLAYPSGEGLYTIHERKRHQEVEAHLQRLIESDPDHFYFVVMDNASAHTTSQLNDFWEKNKHRIEPVFQPTYSPHLNLIERLWRFMRGQITRNQFYQSLDDLCQVIVEWFEKVPFKQFCSLIGINENELLFV